MKAVRQKLKSQQGASILLALLFFLICILVAVSLLMAAVSNAGKIRSNREEHQKHLAVSSALELVCDDFLTITYTVTYKFEKESLVGGGIRNNYTEFFGACSSTEAVYLKKVLEGDLNAVAKQQMLEDWDRFAAEDETAVYNCDFQDFGLNPVSEHVFTIQPVSEEYPQLEEAVKIVISVQTGYVIQLRAELDDYIMQAELIPVDEAIHLLSPSEAVVGENEIAPFHWKKNYVVKNTEETGNTP